MSIQRYEHFSDGELRPVQFNKRGDWVKHDDHKAELEYANEADAILLNILHHEARGEILQRLPAIIKRIESLMNEPGTQGDEQTSPVAGEGE